MTTPEDKRIKKFIKNFFKLHNQFKEVSYSSKPDAALLYKKMILLLIILQFSMKLRKLHQKMMKMVGVSYTLKTLIHMIVGKHHVVMLDE